MTNDTRAAFEAWVTSRECNLIPAGQQWDGIRCEVAWEAWQASRRAALEEARAICHSIAVNTDRNDFESAGAYECEHAIRALADEGVKP